MCCRHCYVGIHFAKIVHLFQMSKEMDKIFLSEPKILTFATIFFTLLPLLTLNGSHPMSVSHQHVRPLPLNLLAVFLGKGHCYMLHLLSSYSADMFVFRYLLSISCHILRYTPLVKRENMDFGMVWRLPQLGQGTGMVYTVACHSMSMARNV